MLMDVAMQVSTMQNRTRPDIVSKKRKSLESCGRRKEKRKEKSPGAERTISLQDIGSVERKG